MKEEMEAALKNVADELNTLKRKNKQEEDLMILYPGNLNGYEKEWMAIRWWCPAH